MEHFVEFTNSDEQQCLLPISNIAFITFLASKKISRITLKIGKEPIYVRHSIYEINQLLKEAQPETIKK